MKGRRKRRPLGSGWRILQGISSGGASEGLEYVYMYGDLPSSPFSNQKEQIGPSEDRFQELEDAFTVRSSWTDGTEMLDLLIEEEEREQEQYLIDMWQKRPQ